MESVAGHRVGRALASDRQREHLFFTGMAVAMALVVLIGFGRSFFFAFMWREHDPDASTEPVYYIHGALAAAWMAFAIFQPLLIRRRKVQWHRRLGWVGAALAGAVMLTGVYVAVLSGARGPGSPLPPTPPDFLGVIASGIVIFGVFVCLAVVYRRNGQAHKRLMYLATVNLIQAAVVRIPWSFVHSAGPWTTYPVAYAFILPLFVWDWRTQGRIHFATLWGGLGIALSLPIRLWLSETSAWLTAAGWLIHLVRK
jgi:uncharacterized membrane protein YozB (DUF420 family)